ncbi:MAG: hypothetical protein Q9188_003971, partial [Gyalolechia gomerana]
NQTHLSTPVLVLIPLLSFSLLALLTFLLHRRYCRYRCRQHARKAARTIQGHLDGDVELAEFSEAGEGQASVRPNQGEQGANGESEDVEGKEGKKEIKGRRTGKGKRKGKGRVIGNGNGLSMTEEEWQHTARVERVLKERARMSVGL